MFYSCFPFTLLLCLLSALLLSNSLPLHSFLFLPVLIFSSSSSISASVHLFSTSYSICSSFASLSFSIFSSSPFLSFLLPFSLLFCLLPFSLSSHPLLSSPPLLSSFFSSFSPFLSCSVLKTFIYLTQHPAYISILAPKNPAVVRVSPLSRVLP